MIQFLGLYAHIIKHLTNITQFIYKLLNILVASVETTSLGKLFNTAIIVLLKKCFHKL